jgi:hypothetical protein
MQELEDAMRFEPTVGSCSRASELLVRRLASVACAVLMIGDPVASAAPSRATGRQAAATGPNDPAPPTAATSPADPPRSLDDLLGLPSTDRASGEAAADRAAEDRLERSLDGASMQDLVARAMDGMREAARRLAEERDAGVGTQRVQEDVVATLDRLLAEAQRQQRSSRGSSRSKSRQSQSSESQDPSEQNGQEQSTGRPSDSMSRGGSNEPGSDESTTSPRSDDAAASGAELEESRVEWGRLPDRVRELILQGRRDRVSTLYERITREYYRRLAEEASR